MSPLITGLQGLFIGQSFTIDDNPLSFGRSADNTVVINSSKVSRHHATIRQDDNGYTLSDQGSSNGTFVNGERIQTQQLRNGDEIEIGDETFQFEVPVERSVFQIVALSERLSNQQFTLNDEQVSFGRSSENTVKIASQQASRHHAKISYEAGRYVLYDLDSSNGTFVNGVRMQSHELHPGDEITIGDETFRFEEVGGADASSNSPTDLQQPEPLLPTPGNVPFKQEEPKGSRAQPAPPAAKYGIRCPACDRTIDPSYQHCPWDGASLANGQTVAIPKLAKQAK